MERIQIAFRSLDVPFPRRPLGRVIFWMVRRVTSSCTKNESSYPGVVTFTVHGVLEIVVMKISKSRALPVALLSIKAIINSFPWLSLPKYKKKQR